MKGYFYKALFYNLRYEKISRVEARRERAHPLPFQLVYDQGVAILL